LSWYDEYAISVFRKLLKSGAKFSISRHSEYACGWQSISECAALAFKGTCGFSRMAEHQFTIRHKAAAAATPLLLLTKQPAEIKNQTSAEILYLTASANFINGGSEF